MCADDEVLWYFRAYTKGPPYTLMVLCLGKDVDKTTIGQRTTGSARGDRALTQGLETTVEMQRVGPGAEERVNTNLRDVMKGQSVGLLQYGENLGSVRVRSVVMTSGWWGCRLYMCCVARVPEALLMMGSTQRGHQLQERNTDGQCSNEELVWRPFNTDGARAGLGVSSATGTCSSLNVSSISHANVDEHDEYAHRPADSKALGRGKLLKKEKLTTKGCIRTSASDTKNMASKKSHLRCKFGDEQQRRGDARSEHHRPDSEQPPATLGYRTPTLASTLNAALRLDGECALSVLSLGHVVSISFCLGLVMISIFWPGFITVWHKFCNNP
ncbi:hypothetical protein H4582DRAFT_2056825 [Lactarius indigo]|nr:hypothetical protein H4582DRAFT_2056825 [Lactarius indigo]